ncbi:hypothetical protein GLAREA_06193 [Glarea lozoyensis ATCC 20868]|uniref:Uncharacterized protein n=2 Tax=Glarea lozoyensis TaxID=101852 RepID=S3DM76_GLAL2|nr:uncharacterized protein GLAREA_06193 [Glarea lozoyensis ATCC 20868]EHL00481.1 hypothetical protein M7I_3565 [Glarea lozoyensis 74030]EPE33181.1 hypothetical protein GLAREA_06193 [Glarea lozoyensis ATCC 20868]
MHTFNIILLAISSPSLFVAAAPPAELDSRILTQAKCCLPGCRSCARNGCRNPDCSAYWPWSTCCGTIIAKKRDEDGGDIWYNENGEVITFIDTPAFGVPQEAEAAQE